MRKCAFGSGSQARAALRALGPALLFARLACGEPLQAAGPSGIPPDGRAGACYTYYPNDPGHPYLPLIHSAGARWDRFDFSWPVIQPAHDQWESDNHDRLVADLRSAGMNIVGILLWTPDWAAAGGANASSARRLARPYPSTAGLALRDRSGLASIVPHPATGQSASRAPHSPPAPGWPDGTVRRIPHPATRQSALPASRSVPSPGRPDSTVSGTSSAPAARPWGWYAPVPGLAPNARTPNAWSRPPRNLGLPWDHPDNYWARFVYTVVARYQHAVKTWELWNEPEWEVFWTGSEADYARLLQVGYRAVKAACSDCTVLFGGLHYWDDPTFYERVLGILAGDPEASQHRYYFDVMSIHLYSHSSSVYDVTLSIRERLRALAGDHPIWLTETGVPVWDDVAVDPDPTPYRWAARENEAAAFVIQSYANAWAAGVERYFFFRTNDADMTEYFGLFRNDLTPRPAYTAFQIAATYLVTPTMTTSVNYSDGARRVTLWGTPRGKVSVLWNTRPGTLTFAYPATLPTATLINVRGQREPLRATEGLYRLDLPGATANLGASANDYIIGGEPYLVLEEDTVPPTATIQPLPPLSPPPAIDISWTGSDDAAGIWAYDVQVQRQWDGIWSPWRNFDSATSGRFGPVLADQTYCFRVRAWDRAGNRGSWPPQAQACTWTGPWEASYRLALPAVWRPGRTG